MLTGQRATIFLDSERLECANQDAQRIIDIMQSHGWAIAWGTARSTFDSVADEQAFYGDLDETVRRCIGGRSTWLRGKLDDMGLLDDRPISPKMPWEATRQTDELPPDSWAHFHLPIGEF